MRLRLGDRLVVAVWTLVIIKIQVWLTLSDLIYPLDQVWILL